MTQIKLENISIKISSGLTPLRTNETYWSNGDIPWVKTEQIGVKNIYDSNEKISRIALKETSIKLNPKNTISIAMYGEGKTRGSVSILRNEVTTNQACCNIVIDKTKADFEYVYYFLKTQYDNLRSLSSGVRKNLNSADIKNFKINIPTSLDCQSQIAKVLSDLDSKIELNNKINAELEAMAKLIYDYWFVQFDFPNKDGKPYKSSGGKMVWSDELKREIPEGWEVEELKNLTTCLMGQSPKGESYNKDGVGIPLLNGPADYENGSLVGRTYTTEPTRLCMKNDMVLCIRATIGNLTFAEKEFCLGRGVAAVRPNKKEFSELIYYFLLQEIERFKKHATGSIIVGITKDDLIDSLVLLPQIELISQFHKLISPMFSNLRKRKEENLELSKLRDWLLPMLMNEQVKVG